MTDINAIVQNAVKDLLSSGTIEDYVKEQVNRTIINAVNEQIGPYSTFGTELKKVIHEKLNINTEDLNIKSYQYLLVDYIHEALDAEIYSEETKKHFKETLKKIMPTDKRSVKLSEILNACKDRAENENSEKVTFIINNSDDSFFYVYFDTRPNIAKYSCSYRLGFYKGWNSTEYKISSTTINDREADRYFMSGPLYGLEQLIFNLYANGAALEIDIDYLQESDLFVDLKED